MIGMTEWLAQSAGPLAVTLDSTTLTATWHTVAGATFVAVGVAAATAAFADLADARRKSWSEDAAVLDRDHREFMAEIGQPRIHDGLTVDRALAPAKDKPIPESGASLARLMMTYRSFPADLRKIAVDLERGGEILRSVERRGRRLDIQWAQRAVAERQPKLTAFKNQYVDVTLGNVHVAEKFLSRVPGLVFSLDIKNPRFGRPTIDKSTIPAGYEEIMEQYSAAASAASRVYDLRKVLKLADNDGRVHAVVRSNSAATGRMTYTDPAIYSWAADVRGAWAADAGKVLVGIDFSSVELRIAAALTGSADLMRRVQESDIYMEFADAMKLPRKVAKTGVISALYGEGKAGRAVRYGDRGEEAKATMDRIFPEFAELIERMTTISSTGGQLITMFGRPLPVPVNKAGRVAHNLATNMAIQATGRDALQVALLKAHELGLDIWLPYHDELVVQCDRGEEAATIAKLTEAMTITLPGTDMVLTGEVTVHGERWTAK